MLFPTLALLLVAAPPAFHVDVVAPGAAKPKMILIPGLQSAGAVWDSTVAHYKERYECHVLTLAGFAGQPPLPAGTPFLKTVREELATYIKAKGLQKPVVVGHSLGGFLALWLASTEPGLTGPIVVVDSLPFLAATMDPKATPESVKPQADAMLAMMGSMQGEAWVKYQRNNPALKMMMSNEAEKPRAIEWGEKSDPRTVANAMFELFQTDLRGDIARIQSRTLVLVALKGYPAGALELYKSQYAKLPAATLVTFEDARHFIMFDQPAKMLAAIDSFLKETK